VSAPNPAKHSLVLVALGHVSADKSLRGNSRSKILGAIAGHRYQGAFPSAQRIGVNLRAQRHERDDVVGAAKRAGGATRTRREWHPDATAPVRFSGMLDVGSLRIEPLSREDRISEHAGVVRWLAREPGDVAGWKAES